MRAVVFENSDGSVSVLYPNLESGLTFEQIVARDVPEGVRSKEVIIEGALDRTYRAAWKFSPETGVEVDMPKAREIHKDRMRAARAPRLAALDVEFMRAVEQENETYMQTIAHEKQLLRDVTSDPRIEAATTPDELKSVWPDILTEAV